MLAAVADAARAAGDTVRETREYEGKSEWLVLYGVGTPLHHAARSEHVARGGSVLMWDLGYWERKKIVGHMRMSINTDHPQQWLDATPDDGARWARAGIKLREDGDPSGHILLIGIGRKSRAYLDVPNWERDAYARLQHRFPGRRIIFRPKGRDAMQLPCRMDGTTPIEDLMRGAALVVCRHSNCAVDAAIAGVQFEAENGAAMWLQQREFTRANRLDFLQRLAHWQYRSTEAAQAWAFAKQVVGK